MKFLEKFGKNRYWWIIFGLLFLTVGNKTVLAADY